MKLLSHLSGELGEPDPHSSNIENSWCDFTAGPTSSSAAGSHTIWAFFSLNSCYTALGWWGLATPGPLLFDSGGLLLAQPLRCFHHVHNMAAFAPNLSVGSLIV